MKCYRCENKRGKFAIRFLILNRRNRWRLCDHCHNSYVSWWAQPEFKFAEPDSRVVREPFASHTPTLFELES